MKQMMASYIQVGDSLNYANKSGSVIAAGDVVKLAERYSVAAADIAVGAVGVVTVDGVFEMPAESTAVFAMGAAVCWDDSAKCVVAKTDGKPVLGWAVVDKAAGAPLAYIKLGG